MFVKATSTIIPRRIHMDLPMLDKRGTAPMIGGFAMI